MTKCLGAGAGGRPGAFFRNRWPFSKVRGRCHIRFNRRMGALVSTKRQFWIIGLFVADTPINSLKLGAILSRQNAHF